MRAKLLHIFLLPAVCALTCTSLPPKTHKAHHPNLHFPTHRLYGRLMGPSGPNLRRLYLPGLDSLKVELACFDWLLVAKQPELQRHLHVRTRGCALSPVLQEKQMIRQSTHDVACKEEESWAHWKWSSRVLDSCW